MNRRLDYGYCKAAPVLEWMSHKWALVTLMRIAEACASPCETNGIRFSDLFRTIPTVSEKMLAATLDYLEGEGLVCRTVHSGFPPSTTYSPSPLGKNFLREISYVIEWGQLHHLEILESRKHRTDR